MAKDALLQSTWLHILTVMA